MNNKFISKVYFSLVNYCVKLLISIIKDQKKKVKASCSLILRFILFALVPGEHFSISHLGFYGEALVLIAPSPEICYFYFFECVVSLIGNNC